MTKRLKRPRDPVSLAKLIGDIATGQVQDAQPDDGKNRSTTLKCRPMKIYLSAAAIVMTAASALAQSVQEWPVTVHQTFGNSQLCPTGNTGGRIRVKDGVMFLVVPNAFPDPLWTVQLTADGSFDGIVKVVRARMGARITVPTGNGPREIKTMWQAEACGYTLIPS
jgi:hypothetical protein